MTLQPFEYLLQPWPSAWVGAAALGVALMIDRLWGELPNRWHPVVWMGRYLSGVAKYIAPSADAQPSRPSAAGWFHLPHQNAFWRGAAAWLVGAVAMVLLGIVLQSAVPALPGLVGALVLGCLLKPLLAWRMLYQEVQAVEAALAESLAHGRARLRWLVSRDVDQLTETQVRESIIESLAENLNDSVVAPIFWFAVLGLPGAALYRFANTADAMWGYRGVRDGYQWEWAGKWAARADDCLSWIPARITAAGLVLVSGGLSWASLWREANRTPSPNSGWPMAAMALLLKVRLRKPGVYGLNDTGRAPKASDTSLAIRFAKKVVIVDVLVAQLAILLIAYSFA